MIFKPYRDIFIIFLSCLVSSQSGIMLGEIDPNDGIYGSQERELYFLENSSELSTSINSGRELFRERYQPVNYNEENRDIYKKTLISGNKYRFVLDPISRTVYYPQVQVISRVVKINVKPGDSFKKGEVLLRLDADKVQAFYSKAKAGMRKAQIEFERKQRLYKDGNASYFEYIEAESNVASAQAEVVFAEKNLEALVVIAPYNGKVASTSIQDYELPLENKGMMELIDDHILVAKFLLPSNLLRDIKVGHLIELDIDETKDRIQAKISRIASVIDPSSSTLKVEADLDNSDGNLMSGMSGSVTLK